MVSLPLVNPTCKRPRATHVFSRPRTMPEINPYEPSSTPASNEDVDLASIDSQGEELSPWPILLLAPVITVGMACLTALPAFMAYNSYPATSRYHMTHSAMLGLSIWLIPPLGTLIFMCRWAYCRWQAQARVRRLINNSSSDTDAQHEED